MIGLIFILQGTAGNFCSGYSCSSNPYTSLSGFCIVQEGATFSLSICDDEYYSYCQPSQQDTLCSLPPMVNDLNSSYVGEPCVYDRTCIDSVCTKGICTIESTSKECTYNSMCSQGYFCNTTISTCTPLLSSKSNSMCTSDYECQYNSGCVDSKCVPYFTLESGSLVNNCINNINLLCTSGSCRSNSDASYSCVSNKASAQSLPIQCQGNQDCVINDGNITYTTRCICGHNQLAQAFCGLAPGDKDFVQLMSLYKSWVTSKYVTNCNTERRLMMPCIQTYSNPEFYAKINYYTLKVENYPLLINNDECVQQIYHSDYYNALALYNSYQEESDSSSFASILIPILSVLTF